MNRWIRQHRVASVFLALTALVVVIVAASSAGSKTTSTPAVTIPTVSASAVATTEAPAPADTSAPTDTAPAMTAAEQQAVDAAQNYLSLGSGFSKAGLLKQLTSSYGNGFSEKDAEFAVSYLKPDWNAQAVESAKSYMAMGGFSRSSLIAQLTSSYGSGFTEAQAEYAADKVGL